MIHKSGEGSLYYRLAFRICPAIPLSGGLPVNKGIKVDRWYYPVEGTLLVDSKGHYYTRLGSLIQVIIRIETLAERYHVALVDKPTYAFVPLDNEEGSEGRTSELQVEGEKRSEEHYDPWHWHDYQRISEHEVQVYVTLMQPGCYIYAYHARVANVGSFFVPATKVEEICHHAYGFSRTDRILVEGMNTEYMKEDAEEVTEKIFDSLSVRSIDSTVVTPEQHIQWMKKHKKVLNIHHNNSSTSITQSRSNTEGSIPPPEGMSIKMLEPVQPMKELVIPILPEENEDDFDEIKL
eukprot:TRINITY_DN2965_c0_g1_i8.p1 TRINITY_DN2965_c0_g1~~TRINITY_DN2965_c0_g1_i8.p1  ORF type:complete len:293 (-),score=55.74 TRINITY_DN2965_c0_g1_i8:537-1415(-)